ncbi:hypothetical protein BKI52_13990 [marine bacterium AO1-C]|nr:hypothetical protein BKI52_13990 [marine bacterium AO1-C]
MFKQKDPIENLQAATLYFLQKLGAKYTAATIKRLLNTHPSYPSVLALTEALSDLNIENMAVNLGVEQLPEVPLPSIAHLEKGHFVVLDALENDQVTYFDPEVGKVTQSVQEFDSQWSGVLVMAELGENAQEKDFLLKQARTPVILGLLAIGLGLGIITGGNYYSTASMATWMPILGLKIIGSVVAVLLVFKEIGINNSLIHRLCDTKTNVSCGQVLDSPAATWFGWLKMSDLGLIYFIGGFLTVLLGLLSQSLLPALVVLGIFTALAVPYSFFSVYYQAKVVKKWCVLCLAVQAIFWLELVTSFQLLYRGLGLINITSISLIVVSFSIVIIGWMLLKPYLQWQKLAMEKETKLNYFLKNEEVMQGVLASTAPITIPYQDEKVWLGNSENPIEIAIVNNPFCQPCARKHEEVIQLLGEFADLIKINVLFVGRDNDDDDLNKVSRQIIAVGLANNSEATLEALSFWFKHKDIKALEKKFPVTEQQLAQATLVHQAQSAWIKEAQIAGTPTMLVENRQLPIGFDVSNLKSYWRSVAYAE